jgi:hypothetical protein
MCGGLPCSGMRPDAPGPSALALVADVIRRQMPLSGRTLAVEACGSACLRACTLCS